MDSFGNIAPLRDDFRCSVCRRKHVFHCEHDTPYRDQILGTIDRGEEKIRSSNSRRRPKQDSYHNETNHSVSYTSKRTINPAHNFNLNADESYYQTRRTDNQYGSNTFQPISYNYNTKYGSKSTDEQKKKKSGCVIL